MSRRRALLVLAIAGIAVTIPAVAGWSHLMGAPSSAPSVVGSWVFVPTGAPGRAAGTPSLVTFTSDGNVLWSGPSGSSSGGHGGWTRTGDHTVTETFVFSRHNGDGVFVGTQKVRLNLSLSATYDEITGSGKTDIFDAQGVVTQSAEITTHATRIKVESP